MHINLLIWLELWGFAEEKNLTQVTWKQTKVKQSIYQVNIFITSFYTSYN